MQLRIWTRLVWLLIATPVLAAESEKTLEIKVGDTTYVGTIAAHVGEQFWLLQRDGRLQVFNSNAVDDYKPLSERFRSDSQVDLRDKLQAEFGHDFEVAASSHYLVVAQRGRAKQYNKLFEELYRHVHVYFTARGFSIRELQFPLIAIVFPDQASFQLYCDQDDVPIVSGFMGYYLPSSNRVALYDTGAADQLADIIVHEAVHQVAYNLGLHRRIGDDPKWIVEGLATTFEPENFRTPVPSTPVSAKINRERAAHFLGTLKNRQPTVSLEQLVKSDDAYHEQALDAYAASWALTFFLLQTRQDQYSRYLKRVTQRPLLENYTSEQRLADFQAVFGNDLKNLETELVRFHLNLK